jgi:sulfite reductase (NADPH) flavoprotein alpha-component
MRKSDHLTRLTLPGHATTTAVCPHRMRDDGCDLWAWLERGAHIYVCSDAAWRDVERALIDVVAEHGKRIPEDAARYLAEMKKNDRYQVDVY